MAARNNVTPKRPAHRPPRKPTRGGAKFVAKFVAAYIVNHNAAEAAIACGYNPKYAKQRANDVMRRADVKAAIKEHQEKLRREAELSEHELLRELARIARCDVRKLFDADTGEMRAITELDDDTAAAVASVKHTTRGSGERAESSVEVKTWDKLQALVAYGKHLGIFEADNRQKAQVNVIANILASLDPGKVELRFAPGGEQYAGKLPRAASLAQQPAQATRGGLTLLDSLGHEQRKQP